MGQSTSRPKLPYLLGVREKNVAITDPQIEQQFEKLLQDVKSRLSTDTKYGEYVGQFRERMSSKYSEMDEIKNAKDVPDSTIRDKIIYIIAAYSKLIAGIETGIKTECSIEGFCPRHVVTENGDVRPLESLDRIHPCQLRSCMREQLESQLAKYKRWIVSGKWAGDTTKSASAPEDVAISHDGLVEILLRLQQSILLNIELASADHSIDVAREIESTVENAMENTNDKKERFTAFTTGLLQRVNWQYILLVVVLVVVVLLLYFWQAPKPSVSIR